MALRAYVAGQEASPAVKYRRKEEAFSIDCRPPRLRAEVVALKSPA